MVFILKWVPGSSYLAHHEIPWFGRILLQAIMGPNKHSTGGLLMGLIDFFCSLEHYWSLCQKEIKTAHFTVCKMRPRQNDDIFKCIFLVENCCALSQTPINNKSGLFKRMAWHWTSEKPLSEPIMAKVTDICALVGRPDVSNITLMFTSSTRTRNIHLIAYHWRQAVLHLSRVSKCDLHFLPLTLSSCMQNHDIMYQRCWESTMK